MKVQELINQLQQHYSPDTEIYVEYWDKDLVDGWLATQQYTNFGELAKQVAQSVDYQIDRDPQLESALNKISQYEATKLTDDQWASVVEHMEYSDHAHMGMVAETLVEMAEHVIDGCDASDED